MRAPRPLMLVGAGGLGRETLNLIDALNYEEPRWAIQGFVDDDSSLAGSVVSGVRVLGPSELVKEANSYVVLCLGNDKLPYLRLEKSEYLGLEPERYATLVHPSAGVSSDSVIGPGSVLFQNVVMTAGVSIGSQVLLMPGVTLTHDDVIRNGATMASGACVGGRVEIGECAYVGMSATIRQGLTIGRGSVIGMGAVVLEDVPAEETWAGTPARKL